MGHEIQVLTKAFCEHQKCLRCGEVWLFKTRPAYGVGTYEAERLFSPTSCPVCGDLKTIENSRKTYDECPLCCSPPEESLDELQIKEIKP